MKILAIDDQKLVLLPLEKRLKNLGYEVKIETNARKAMELFETFNPCLVIVDLNMPDMCGRKIIKYIREEKKSQTPIMVLSGNTDDDVIIDCFELGANGFMKKPLSLNEVSARIKNLMGAPEQQSIDKEPYKNVTIHQSCVGVVIPCYNEEKRLLSDQFLNFIDQNSGYHLCFVDDGSTDQTFEVLNKLKEDREDLITVYQCKKNGGKAEAVRQGMKYLSKNMPELDYIGFLDADLSTDLSNFDSLVNTIEKSDYKVVCGSRITRIGANITKESTRLFISATINYFIRKILKMNFKDTQCGAKIFHKEIIDVAFKNKFITKWLFDIEIFLRIRKKYSLETAKTMICEQPLKKWVHADGSKLSLKDSLKIIFQLIQISWKYNWKNPFKKEKVSFEVIPTKKRILA